MAVSADAPAPTWLISSEDENSQQSNSSSTGHAIENVAGTRNRNEVQVDSCRFHFAGQQRHHAVICGAGK